MGKLKIGFVLDDTLDTPDGVQQYILTLGAWLSRQGHEVHYLVGQTARTDIKNVHSIGRNLRVKFNGNRMSTPLPAGRRAVRRVLAQQKFDVLHIQMPYSPFMAGRIIKAAPATTVVVGTFHIAPQSGLVRRANQLLGIISRRTLRRFDDIFSVSAAAAAFARQTYGLETSVIPNVVEAARFASAKPFDLRPPLPTIVFVGRLVPRKGCQVLLEALAKLRAEAAPLPFRAIICGKGPLEAALKTYAADAGLAEHVTFTGFVSEAEKARYLKTADIAVFPSTGGESFGIVLIEAMAAEHPVVLGADNEGYHTVLAPQPSSLVPVSDAGALATKLQQFLTDQSAFRLTLDWQKTYVRQFDVAAVGPRLVARYTQALRSRSDVR